MKRQLITTFDAKIRNNLNELMDIFCGIDQNENSEVFLFDSIAKEYLQVRSEDYELLYGNEFDAETPRELRENLISKILGFRNQHISNGELNWVLENENYFLSIHNDPSISCNDDLFTKSLEIYSKYIEFINKVEDFLIADKELATFLETKPKLNVLSIETICELLKEEKAIIEHQENKEKEVEHHDNYELLISVTSTILELCSDLRFGDYFLEKVINNSCKIIIWEKIRPSLRSIETYRGFHEKEYLQLPLEFHHLGITVDEDGFPDDLLMKVPNVNPREYLNSSNAFESNKGEIIFSKDFFILSYSKLFPDSILPHPESIDGEYSYWIDIEGKDWFEDFFGFNSILFGNILHKLELFELNLQKHIETYKNQFSNSEIFKDEIQALTHLKNGYEQLIMSSRDKLIIFYGVKFPKRICDLFSKCIIEIINKEISKREGKISEFILSNPFKDGKSFLASDDRIPWKANPAILIELFSILIDENVFVKNSKMTKNEYATFLCSSFFSCFSSPIPKNQIKINSKKYLFFNFWYLIYTNFKKELEYIDQVKIGTIIKKCVHNYKDLSDSQLQNTILKNLTRTGTKTKYLNLRFKEVFDTSFPERNFQILK